MGCYGESTDGSQCCCWFLGFCMRYKNKHTQSTNVCCFAPISILYSEHQSHSLHKNIYYSICCGMYARQYTEHKENKENKENKEEKESKESQENIEMKEKIAMIIGNSK